MLARPVTHLVATRSCATRVWSSCGPVVTHAALRIAGPVAALRAFVAEARRVGPTPTEAAAMVREEMSS